ncbi:electron transfer flavoprotein subunit beta/FixA family protein [Nocardioides sp.]|uniref:electron transfer flavoprotein subunit beta/FixA family protein n=1 Tax=Nocardioides sp. TaxID=35761 RepID=UPI003D0DC3C1
MNIIVCVKYTPDTAADRKFGADHTVDRGSDGLLCELDEYAVEQALRIKEGRPDEEVNVTALTVGPAEAEIALRKALQMGADHAVHVADDAIAGSDAAATSLVLAKAIERNGIPDLIIGGLASTDAGMGVLTAMLAERLNLPQVTLASVVEMQGAEVRIKRDGDTATEIVGGTLPLVMSVTDQSGEVRYPTFKGVMAAKKKQVQTLSLLDIGVDRSEVGLAAAWTKVRGTSERPPRTAGVIVRDSDGSGAAAVFDFLASNKFV